MIQSHALSILKTGANVFLTGEAGSGKTHIVNEYVAYLRNRGIEPAITASTGIAATHIGGMTVHSWSGIGIKARLDKRDLHKIASTQYIVRRVRRAKVLIIEEVSMLLPGTLSMVDAVCREIKQNSEPFGGMQIIFSGDFFQLPPVVKTEIGNRGQTAFIEQFPARFAYESSAWTEADPIVCYLTEQYRQDDSNFLAILSAIRSNVFNNDHLRQIATRKIERHAIPPDVPKLFSHNADVDRLNNAILEKISGMPRIFTMSFEGPEAFVTFLKKGCLSPEILSLKVGAAVMFTKNHPKKGFVNGTLGVVEGFNKTGGYPMVKTRNGERIEVEPMDWTLEENGKILAQISQMPLRLAWAITVHKSQGMNLDEAVMDLSDVFEFGQGYVALSRIRRLSGLYLMGWNERAFQVHPAILAQDEIFRLASGNAKITFSKISPTEFQKRQSNFISVCGGKTIPEVQTGFPKVRPSLVKRWEHTLTLILSGKTIATVAKIRSRSEKTILEHLESLRLIGKLSMQDLKDIILKTKTRDVFDERQSRQSGFEMIRKIYPNAYRLWDKKQDNNLQTLFVKGLSVTNLAKKFGRKNGAIKSRLIKLGLINNS